MSDFQQWVPLLQEQLSHTDAIQWAVLILGVTEVLLARANNVLLYPAGIGAAGLAIISLFSVGLFAECALHFYYVIMSVYGWWFWLHKKHSSPVKISYATRVEWVTTFTIVFAGWLVIAIVLSKFTSSTVPLWDAWVTSTAWAGMWLLARRKIENWILLNVSNLFAIPLLFQKELPLFALLTTFLFIVACKGYLDWIRKYESERQVHGPQSTDHSRVTLKN